MADWQIAPLCVSVRCFHGQHGSPTTCAISQAEKSEIYRAADLNVLLQFQKCPHSERPGCTNENVFIMSN